MPIDDQNQLTNQLGSKQPISANQPTDTGQAGVAPQTPVYIPSGPEQVFVEERKPVEKITVEVAPIQEVPSPKVPTQPQHVKESVATISPTQPKQKNASIVDNTNKKTKVHKLETPDEITNFADEEEEEFIESVEAAHEPD